jgi:hypothetical protein
MPRIALHAIKPRKSHYIVSLVAFLGGISAAVPVLDAWPQLLVDFGYKPSEASVLAEQTAQGEFLRQTLRLVAKRLFWVERYSGEVQSGFAQPELDEAWKQYNASVIEWNESYILNYVLTGKYFGSNNAALLADINWLMLQTNSCLNRIYYRPLYTADPACHFPLIEQKSSGTVEDNLKVLGEALKKIGGEALEYAGTIAK